MVELLIVVAIVAVLATIAMPAYQGSVRKARRSDAIAEAARAQLAQERWRANNVSYSADVSSSVTGLRLTPGTVAVDHYSTPAGYYTLEMSGNTATGYVLTVSARAGTSQAADAPCQCLRVSWLNGGSTYEAAAAEPGRCAGVSWSTAHAANCWRR